MKARSNNTGSVKTTTSCDSTTQPAAVQLLTAVGTKYFTDIRTHVVQRKPKTPAKVRWKFSTRAAVHD